jgi:hypothetical protein
MVLVRISSIYGKIDALLIYTVHDIPEAALYSYTRHRFMYASAINPSMVRYTDQSVLTRHRFFLKSISSSTFMNLYALQ